MKTVAAFSALTLAAASSVDHEPWLDTISVGLPKNPVEAGKEIIQRIQSKVAAFKESHPDGVASEYPYFNFLPQYQLGLIPDHEVETWSSPCFASNSGKAVTQDDGNVKVTITSSNGPATEGCMDDYAFMTVTGTKRVSLTDAGDFSFMWNLPEDIRDAERWDLANKGIRVFHYQTDVATTIANVAETLLLFIPETTKHVDPRSAKRNVDFMAKYPQFKMEERDPKTSLPPMEHEVHSGDFFGVIRLDGLDPMLAWAMGSTTGHTTVALWIDGELYVCESTVTDSYWPTNGIQKTPYRTWLKQAQEAGYNVVWAPLDRKNRARFNETAAVEFFHENEGLDYGYRNMLYGWIDTLTDNYPCVPSDYSSVCAQWSYFETLFGVLDRNAPELVNTFVNQAFNLRLGTSGLRLPEILEEAANQGIESAAIPAIVEQDSWLYNTTRNGEPAVGRSMVCCVYVCSTWKAAGLFGDDEVNCGEMTNVDDYTLAIFDADRTKQIIGQWTLEFNRFNMKEPYAHMGETCSSLAPDYEQKVDC